MSLRKHRRGRLSSASSSLFDDGVDPRGLHGDPGAGRAQHKSLQLCAQAAEALHAALAGECRDPVLQELTVVSVTPAGGTGRLLAVVELPAGPSSVTPELARERLERAAGLLRCAVATAVCRRRAPELTFRVVPPSVGGTEGVPS